jgi:hypothetical protein
LSDADNYKKILQNCSIYSANGYRIWYLLYGVDADKEKKVENAIKTSVESGTFGQRIRKKRSGSGGGSGSETGSDLPGMEISIFSQIYTLKWSN